MNKETLYQISWKQEYTEYQKFAEGFIDSWDNYLLESSEYKEANQVIERIKNL